MFFSTDIITESINMSIFSVIINKFSKNSTKMIKNILFIILQ